jgi:HPt (histidine-containing phosphotransfer) domain-containing protein
MLSQKLPGIDVIEGMKNLGLESEPETFKIIMKKFGESYQDTLATIQDACHCKNMDSLKRMAHTIKGSSKSIGAIQLYKKAIVLEEYLKATISINNDDHQITSLTEALKTVLESIGRVD